MVGTNPISDDDLNNILQFMANYPPPYSPISTDFINDLYVTGCRPNDILEITRWSQDPGNADQWKLQPQKNNYPRYFNKAILSAGLNTAIINQIPPYDRLTLRQLEYTMLQINPVGAISTAHKLISAYSFRYNRVRNYLKEGKTQAEITTLFGWHWASVSLKYSFTQLYSVYPLIPAETFFIIDANNYAIIDSDGSKILDT